MYKKIDKIFKLLVGISFSVLVFYEISGIKKAIQRIVLFMEKENIMLGITYSNVLTIIVLLRKASLICIFCYITFIIISEIVKKAQNIYSHHNINTNNSFESSMLKYLNDKNEKKTYLVIGDPEKLTLSLVFLINFLNILVVKFIVFHVSG